MATLRAGALLARRYRLIDPIGAGGMSIIWRARDELLDRMVAIKVLASELAADARFRALVREEARAAAQLVHPHVTAVHDYGELVGDDGTITAFVVMELLRGEELEARLTAGPLPWQEAIEVCAQVAEALAAAHRLGIVHRDVTPANIMLTANGAKVLDFGIATHIGAPDEDEDGDTFGTPAYVAPERLDGVPAQPATDTYSLGVLLFETLSGRVPFPAETWDDLARTQPGGPMPPLVVPGLPAQVVETCRQCLSRDPVHRPTAHQVGETLREQLMPTDPYAYGVPAGIRAMPAGPHADAAPVALAAAAGSMATLVGGAVGGLTVPVGYGWAGSGPPSDPGRFGAPGRLGGGRLGGPGHLGAEQFGAGHLGDGGGGSTATIAPSGPYPPGPYTPGGPHPPGGPYTPGGPHPPGGSFPPGPYTPGGPGHPPGTSGGADWPPAPPRRPWSPLRAGLAATGSVAALTAALLIGLNLGSGNDTPSGFGQSAQVPQVAPSPGPAGTPEPTTAPNGGASANAAGTPERSRRSTAPVPSVQQAMNALGDVIDEGLARRDIRRDVGIDLQQMLNNLRISIAKGPTDVDGTVIVLREKVTTRANEGAITPRYKNLLETALDTLETAR